MHFDQPASRPGCAFDFAIFAVPNHQGSNAEARLLITNGIQPHQREAAAKERLVAGIERVSQKFFGLGRDRQARQAAARVLLDGLWYSLWRSGRFRSISGRGTACGFGWVRSRSGCGR